VTKDILPFNKAVEHHLLQRLSKRSRPVRPSELYDGLADDLKLTSQQRLLKRQTTDGSLWHNRVQTARKHLVERGWMNRLPIGKWSLTEAGKVEAERVSSLIFDIDLSDFTD
jgi:restriction endonuclease Mrr